MSVPAQVAQATLTATPTDTTTSTDALLQAQKPAAVAPVETPKTETKTETSKAPEVAKTEIQYSLKLPEGSLVDAKHAEEIVAFAKAQGFSNEQAQGILNRENGAVAAHVEAQKQTLKSKSAEWVDQVMQDTEIGGTDFLKNAELAKRVTLRFGDEALVKGLNETGLGNHPSLVKMFVRIGKLMSEDQLILAPSTAPSAGSKKSVAERLYDHPTSQTKE